MSTLGRKRSEAGSYCQWSLYLSGIRYEIKEYKESTKRRKRASLTHWLIQAKCYCQRRLDRRERGLRWGSIVSIEVVVLVLGDESWREKELQRYGIFWSRLYSIFKSCLSVYGIETWVVVGPRLRLWIDSIGAHFTIGTSRLDILPFLSSDIIYWYRRVGRSLVTFLRLICLRIESSKMIHSICIDKIPWHR